MTFWEFFQKTSIKIGVVEIDGFGANVICFTFAVLLLRFGFAIGPAILRRFTKSKDLSEIRSQILREIEAENKRKLST